MKELSRSQAVRQSRVHFKSDILSETVLDRDVETTGHQQEVTYGLSKSSNCDDVGCTTRSFVDGKRFQMGCFVVARFLLTSASRGPSAIAELFVL